MRENMERCPVKGATCKFWRKVGHYERFCSGKCGGQRESRAVGVIQEQGDQRFDDRGELEDQISQHNSSIDWVNTTETISQWRESDSSGDNLAITFGFKRCTKMEVAMVWTPIGFRGKTARVLIANNYVHRRRTAEDTGSVKFEARGIRSWLQRTSRLREPRTEADGNEAALTGIQRVEGQCEDKRHRREPSVYIWTRFDGASGAQMIQKPRDPVMTINKEFSDDREEAALLNSRQE